MTTSGYGMGDRIEPPEVHVGTNKRTYGHKREDKLKQRACTIPGHSAMADTEPLSGGHCRPGSPCNVMWVTVSD